MRLELVCVGTELLSAKVNTHIAYVGEKLAAIGLRLDRVVTAPDDIQELASILKESFSRAGVVIITGGLGPTFDDITRQAAARAAGAKLVFNRELMAEIARFFAERGREMPKNNESQAYLIGGARPIHNKFGTAPGQIIEGVKGMPLVFLLPGPPRELRPMLEGVVLPFLKAKFESGITKKKILHVFGLPESKVDETVRPVVEMERRIEGGAVSFTILEHTSFIDVSFAVSGKDELLIDDMVNKIKSELASVLGTNLFGEDAQTLESVVYELMVKNRKTLSVAESCTGGLLASRITNVPGSSAYFKLGVESYSNESKIDILGVNPETLERFGAVSEQTAVEMARGALKAGRSDIAVSVTGIAGPGGGTPEKPVGTVWFALVSTHAGTGIKCKSQDLTPLLHFTGGRLEIKERAASYALFIIRNFLLGLKK